VSGAEQKKKKKKKKKKKINLRAENPNFRCPSQHTFFISLIELGEEERIQDFGPLRLMLGDYLCIIIHNLSI